MPYKIKVCPVAFNFLASLINGNKFLSFPSPRGDESFNFLASLINGNFLASPFPMAIWALPSF